jgi:hypothetical protein
MPKKGRSKSHTRSHAKDASDDFCERNGFTSGQYAKMYHHMQCENAPAHGNRARGSSQARSDGGRSGHTSRAASPSRGPPRDPFRDAVKRRYKAACDFVKGNEAMILLYTRNTLIAKAYELQEKNDQSMVVSHLVEHGSSDQNYFDKAKAMFPEIGNDQLNYKKPTDKSVWAKKWAEALQQMHESGYEWDLHFSKHKLRALMLQKCSESQHDSMTLQDYVSQHSTPGDLYIRLADATYPKDEKTVTKFNYQIRKNQRYTVAGHPPAHEAHATHSHAHAVAHTPGGMLPTPPSSRSSHKGQAPRMGPSDGANLHMDGVSQAVNGSKMALIGHDLSDDINDDYRV